MSRYYDTLNDCENNKNLYVNLNPRYKNFKQRDYTAGDTGQFEFVYNLSKGRYKPINLENNIFVDSDYAHIFFPKYANLDSNALQKTFEYLFFKFKKGVYIKIKNNKLQVFLPFSNANYYNEWYSQIVFDENIFKKISKAEGRTFKENKVNKFVKNWFANNHLIRYEYPINENDTNIDVIKDMFIELCNSRQIPDMEFFLNKRDFPLLTKDGTEPYVNIWNSFNKPLVSHNENKYIPILSMCISDRFADVVIPTYEDWSRTERKHGKFFMSTYTREYDDCFYNDWENKKNIAIFRGTNTGEGVTIETNLRLKLANLSYQMEKSGIYILDAGITKWNSRARKIYGENKLDFFDPNNVEFGLKQSLSPYEQSKYKYIINVDGHVTAYRLSLEMGMNSVILKVDSKWKIWYSHLLKPYEHYIPIKSDMSDIVEKIEWCIKNDSTCKQIAKNARLFYEQYLSRNSILDYLQKTLFELKDYNGYYKNQSMQSLLFRKQVKTLNKSYTYPFVKSQLYPNDMNNFTRNYSNLKALEYVVNFLIINNNDKLMNGEIVFNNKNTTILKQNVVGVPIAIKVTNKDKYKKNINNTFVGKYIVNEFIKNNIPNYSYTFNSFVCNDKIYTVYEYIDGVNLLEYIKNSKFNYNTFIRLTLQICLCLHSSQEINGYIHNDLTPWNIIVRKLDSPIKIEYNINNKVYKIRSAIIPVIIDFENSQGMHDNIKYGFDNDCSSNIKDIIMYLITVLNIITTNNLFRHSDIINIANYLHFLGVSSMFKNINSVKSFLFYNRKYDNLIRIHKKVNGDKNLIDLFNHISNNQTKVSYQISIFNEKKNHTNAAKIFYNLFSINTCNNNDIKFDVNMQKMDIITKYYYIYLLECYTETNENILNRLYNTNSTINYDLLNNETKHVYDSYKLVHILTIILSYDFKNKLSIHEKKYLLELKTKITKSEQNTLNMYFYKSL